MWRGIATCWRVMFQYRIKRRLCFRRLRLYQCLRKRSVSRGAWRGQLNHPKDRYHAIWYLVSALTHQKVRWLVVMVMLVQTKKRDE